MSGKRSDYFDVSAPITALLIDVGYVDPSTSPMQWTRDGVRSVQRRGDWAGVLEEAIGWLPHRHAHDTSRIEFSQRGLKPFVGVAPRA